MDYRNALISVIIPVYNVAGYLRKCIQSVLDNTYRELEIICIDDGSTDGSDVILEQFAESDNRIRVFHQSNGGISAARNRGIEVARGQYVSFIDADDCILPQYFDSMMRCIISKNASLVICGCREFGADSEVIFPHYESIHYRRSGWKDFFEEPIARNKVWARLYRKTDMEGIRFAPEVRMSEDTLFNLSVVSNMTDPKIYITDVPMYFYLNRDDSASHDVPGYKYLDFGKWYQRNGQLVEKGNWDCIVCLEAIKLTLAYRYLTSFYKDAAERKASADILLLSWIRKIAFSKKLSLKQKGIHALMAIFPRIYRHYRIMNDTTLKNWERHQCKTEGRSLEIQ